MRLFVLILFTILTSTLRAQDFKLLPLEFEEFSTTRIQSPLYQSFEINEFDLLVKNINVFASPKETDTFNFLEASAIKENRQSYQEYYSAVERQMAQYANFRVEINNSKSAPWVDYHDQPIYSGSNRLRNNAYQPADRLSGAKTNNPFYFSPSLSARRSMLWY